MTIARAKFLALQCAKNAVSGRGLEALLAYFGAWWLVLQITDYFVKDSPFTAIVRVHLPLFLSSGVAFAIWRCRPISRIAFRLKDRDVTIALAIGDLFSFKGAVVVGSNTTFDVSTKVISEKSAQGQFTKRYYDGESQLEAELEAQLRELTFEELEAARMGKNKRYRLGTVVQLQPKARIGYLVAISHINEHGIAEGTFDGLKNALVELWVFIGSRGSKDQIVMPALGSGFGRLTQSRETIVQEIIKSFVAACAEKTFCENLTIVLAERDVLEKQIDFDSLGEYLKYVCRYTEFSDLRSKDRFGTPDA